MCSQESLIWNTAQTCEILLPSPRVIQCPFKAAAKMTNIMEWGRGHARTESPMYLHFSSALDLSTCSRPGPQLWGWHPLTAHEQGTRWAARLRQIIHEIDIINKLQTMQNYSAATNWFIIKVSGKINTCWNLKQIKISSTPHNLTGTHRAHIWLIASLTAELFPVGGEFVKLWLFWWVISDMRQGAAVLHSFHLCSRPRCRLCRPRLPLLAAGPISCPAQLIMSARDHESESDHGNALRFDNFIQEQTRNKIFQEKQLTII